MKFKVVKYDESYAGKVADMWNHSRDGWGGANTVDTEETILHRERNSSNIHTYLALDNEKVVGYCGLSEYRDDKGALYIPLLNVRDDYHGRKIGKKLLLIALQEAIDLQWPRLDLYTWPGNTKAVPLYKKCGFFWEDRDDTTHLMNFMPTVLHTEAVKYFFEHVDWYDVSTREIEVKPDGRVENDFHHYEYAWETKDATLRIEFERTGRGIRLIETDDYLISATVDQHQLVFGSQYHVRYLVKNKTGKELTIDLRGVNDENIEFSLERSINVTSEEEIVGTFYVGEIKEEQNTFRTHPCVKATVHINGKEAEFKVGIQPNYPGQVTAQLPEHLTFPGKESVFYLDMMNNFRENIRFVMELPDSHLLDIKTPHLDLAMGPKEKKSIPIEFVTNSHGFYDALMSIKAIKENGEVIDFTRKFGVALRGIGAKFHGEDEKNIQLYNGQYFINLLKQDNVFFMGRENNDHTIMLRAPKLGKPYTEEISRAKHVANESFTGTGFIGGKVTYEPTAFPGLRLHVVTKLFSEGLVETYYEIENIADASTEQPISAIQGIFLNLEKATIPYQGKIVEMNDSVGNSYDDWDGKELTENWLFVKNDHLPLGIAWHYGDDIHFDEWYSYLEHHLGTIPGKSIVQTNRLFLSFGAFYDVESLRAFALQSFQQKVVQPVNHVKISLENDNPFVIGEKATFNVTDYKSNYLHGKMAISLSRKKEPVVVEQFDREEKKTNWTSRFLLNDLPPITTVKARMELDATVVERETLLIRQTNQNIKREVINEQGFDVWTVQNGDIQFKAAPDFYPAVYSLKYQEREWLDHRFPALEPRLWWNPWTGGLTSGLFEIRPYSLLKQTTEATFASLTDHKGNEWSGIKLSTSIIDNEEFKGFTYHQYFLTLPGVPILCHVTKIEQDTGKFFNGETWSTSGFFKPAARVADNWVQFQNQSGDWSKLTVGKDENEFSVERNVVIGSNDREDRMHVISNSVTTKREAYVNKEVLLIGVDERITVPSGTTQFTTPNFYLFNDTIIPEAAQHDLQRIRFE